MMGVTLSVSFLPMAKVMGPRASAPPSEEPPSAESEEEEEQPASANTAVVATVVRSRNFFMEFTFRKTFGSLNLKYGNQKVDNFGLFNSKWG